MGKALPPPPASPTGTAGEVTADVQQAWPRPFGRLRRAATVAVIRFARRLMPALVALAGQRCWDCGRRITPTVQLPTYHIVEARLWAWEEVLCDSCMRTRLKRFGGLGVKH